MQWSTETGGPLLSVWVGRPISVLAGVAHDAERSTSFSRRRRCRPCDTARARHFTCVLLSSASSRSLPRRRPDTLRARLSRRLCMVQHQSNHSGLESPYAVNPVQCNPHNFTVFGSGLVQLEARTAISSLSSIVDDRYPGSVTWGAYTHVSITAGSPDAWTFSARDGLITGQQQHHDHDHTE